ncbi:MAG: hypothetical protein ACI8WB_000609 [Phenylobacterium sp.]|jgi:hypothetical protein
MFPWKSIFTTFIIGLLCTCNPASARFVSNDPVTAQSHLQQGNIQGFNRYAYGNNNPYKFTDPDGRNPLLVLVYAPEVIALTKATALVGSATAVAYGGSEAINQYQEGTRKLDDLETIHDADHPQNDPQIGDLSDSELENAIKDPSNGDKVTVKGGKVYDGNTRINEAKTRGFDGNMVIPVVELPNPTVDNDDPLGSYRDDN